MSSTTLLHLPSSIFALITPNLHIGDICNLISCGNSLLNSRLHNGGLESVTVHRYRPVNRIWPYAPLGKTDAKCRCCGHFLQSLKCVKHAELDDSAIWTCWRAKPLEMFSSLGSSLETLIVRIIWSFGSWFQVEATTTLELDVLMPKLKRFEVYEVEKPQYKTAPTKICWKLPPGLEILRLPNVSLNTSIAALPQTLRVMTAYLSWHQINSETHPLPRMERLNIETNWGDEVQPLQLPPTLTRLHLKLRPRHSLEQECYLAETLASLPMGDSCKLKYLALYGFPIVPFHAIPDSVTRLRIGRSFNSFKPMDVTQVPSKLQSFEFRSVVGSPSFCPFPSTLKVLELVLLDDNPGYVRIPPSAEELILGKWELDDVGFPNVKRLTCGKVPAFVPLIGFPNLESIFFECEPNTVLDNFNWVPKQLKKLRVEIGRSFDPSKLHQLSDHQHLHTLAIRSNYKRGVISTENWVIWRNTAPLLPKNLTKLRLDFNRFYRLEPKIVWPKQLLTLSLPTCDMALDQIQYLPTHLKFLRLKSITTPAKGWSQLVESLHLSHPELLISGMMRSRDDDSLF